MQPLLVKNLVKHYGSVQALRGVSFDVRPGEVFGLLGPNGAGKTSLISVVVSLEEPTEGSVLVFDKDVRVEPRAVKCQLGWVPQEVINSGYFSVEEIMRFHAGYFGVSPSSSRLPELMKMLGIWDHRHKKVKQLSGGMKRRLMIAKALIHKPGLILLDEPTAGVDVELRAKLWELILELRASGVSILLTTHYLEEAQQLCDRVAIIHQGEIRAIDKTQALIEKFSRKQVNIRLSRPLVHLNHPDLFRGAGENWVFLTGMKKPVGELIGELGVPASDVADVSVVPGSLEDVFLRFTREENQNG
ncbi:MAG: ABC transporter ATP-binding protein [Bdellovibrionales bacterium]